MSVRPVDENALEAISYHVNPAIGNDPLNALFSASWPRHIPSDFSALHCHSLAFVCAFAGDNLVGYVNLAWDGGAHAFLLDTTVHPNWRRRGIGRELVRWASAVAQEQGIEWLHVDYEPHLTDFYRACGFLPTEAGLIHLDPAGDGVMLSKAPAGEPDNMNDL